MSDTALTGSGAEHVEVVAVLNVLGLRTGDRAIMAVDTPELADCLALDFVRLVREGVEVVPEAGTVTRPRCCGQT